MKEYHKIETLFEKQQKEIEKRLKEIDSLYKMMSVKDDEIEKLKEDYQILKDDIEGHRIAYVDTPEFEENYISKDKIKEKIKELKKQYDEDMENLEKGLIKGSSAIINNNIKINILQELLVSGQESDQEGG